MRRETDLAGSQMGGAAADHRHHRRTVVRRTERRTLECPDPDDVSGGAPDHRHLQRLGLIERREQPRQATGEHRLAGPGRADHEHVMPTRCGHLERRAREGVTADVGEVGSGIERDRRFRIGRVGPWHVAPQARHELPEIGRNPQNSRAGDAGLRRCRRRHDDLAVGGRRDERCETGRRTQRSVEAQLGDERATRHRLRFELALCDEKAHRNREIDAGTALALAGTEQIDRHPPVGPRKAAGEERGSHAVAGLAARLVGQPDHREPRNAHADVDLDDQPVAERPEQ